MSERMIHKQATPPADLDAVWHAWTTIEGAATFFAPAVNIELRHGGPYEIFFFPDRPPGQRGAEGTKVLSYLPRRMLSFEWDAPPKWPAIRAQRTIVVVLFEPVADGTQVDFYHLGWGEGAEWGEVFAYFEEAWDTIMGRLMRRFEEGPIDWENR
jgi:uncharacterized protein YndB with AHSA1/START domain